MHTKHSLQKLTAIFAATAIATTILPTLSFAEGSTINIDGYSTEMRGLSAFQIVNDMGAGWNLGNSLESDYNETYWGNPTTTKAMIDDIANKGFTTLRVPVRWDDNYSNASTYTISDTYMNRVEEVVNYGLDNDMYVILNVHHNDLQHNVPQTEAISAELSAIWTQVGNRFKNYGDKLIFEVNNEPRCGDDWTGNATYYQSVNDCNEAARAAIRATGGNNTRRLVMLPTYCASGDDSKAAAWTKNASDDMIAVSIHAYLPYDFAFEGTGHTDWRDSDLTELQSFFDRMYTHFLSKNIPVVIGEFGARNKAVDNINDRITYAGIYGQLARQFAAQDIPCIWWDNNCFYTNGENFGIYNRSSRSFTFGGIADALISAYDDDPVCETASVSEIIVSSQGGSTSGGWGQAVCFSGSIVKGMSSGQSVYVNYSCTKAPYLILQDNDIKSWISLSADSVSNGVAVWSYDTIANGYASTGNLSDVDNVFIGDDNAALTVTKVYINDPNAHTHNYNGTTNITLEPTATTYGRKTIACSVNGCDAIKVVRTEPVTVATTPQNVKATAGAGQATISWDAFDNATNYLVYTYNGDTLISKKTTTSTSYTVTDLIGGINYTFKVKAYVNNKWTNFSDAAYATPTAGTIPTNISAAAGAGQVKVSWNAVSGATQYLVYTYSGNTLISKNTTTSTSYTVTNLTGGTKYTFKVKSYVNSAWSGFSSAVTATPTTSTVPDGVKAAAADSKVTISWNAVDNATQYLVYTYNGSTLVSKKTAASTSYTVSGLTNGTKYTFRVKSYVNNTWSGFSSSVNATPTTSTIPSEVSATAGDAKVTVQWNAVNNAAQYLVYTYNGDTLLSKKTATNTSYTVSGLTNGTTYTFKVKSYVNGIWSGFSSAVKATPASTAPTNVKAAASNGKVTVSWSAVNNATQYLVYTYNGDTLVSKKTAISTSYTVSGLTNGTTYTFKVKSYVNNTWSSFSSAINATPKA